MTTHLEPEKWNLKGQKDQENTLLPQKSMKKDILLILIAPATLFTHSMSRFLKVQLHP